jgi:hypothetical protein
MDKGIQVAKQATSDWTPQALSWKSISHSTTWRHYWHPDTATRCIWQSKCILCVQRTQVLTTCNVCQIHIWGFHHASKHLLTSQSWKKG